MLEINNLHVKLEDEDKVILRGVDLQRLGLGPHQFKEIAGRKLFLAARLALRVQRGAQEGHVANPRNFHGILERQEKPGRRPLFRFHLQQFLPVQRGGAFGDLITVAA